MPSIEAQCSEGRTNHLKAAQGSIVVNDVANDHGLLDRQSGNPCILIGQWTG
jgi:hypothetical protein